MTNFFPSLEFWIRQNVPAFELSYKKLEHFFSRLAFNWPMRAALYRHLSVQLNNGINQVVALETFKRRLARKKRYSCISVVDDIIHRIRNGIQLSVALRIWVPNDEAFTIAGAEMAGNIEQAFDLLLTSKARIETVRQSMTAAFTTPIVYLCAIYGMLWAIGMFFLPHIRQVMPTGNVQGLGAFLFSLGDFATSFWILIPVILTFGLCGWIFWALPNWTSKYRTFIENFFPFSFYRDLHGYVWILTFASMLQAGISDTHILRDQSRFASPWLRQRLMALQRRMINGEDIADALGRIGFNFPNPDMIDDIASMAGFEDFPARLIKRTIDWSNEMEGNVKTNVKRVGFFFNILMYALILLLLLGINSLSVQMGSVPGL